MSNYLSISPKLQFTPHHKIIINPTQISIHTISKEPTRTHIGKDIAFRIFDMFRGHWQIFQMKNNTIAREFWLDVVCGYTKGTFEEITMENGDPSGTTLNFSS